MGRDRARRESDRYGPVNAELNRRVATYVDKILKGTRPAYLPIEQPTEFELVIN